MVEFHANLLRKWAIDHELLLEGEGFSAPCDRAIKRPSIRHYLLDASLERWADCVERKAFWRYDLPKELTAELERKTDGKEACTGTTNLLRVIGKWL